MMVLQELWTNNLSEVLVYADHVVSIYRRIEACVVGCLERMNIAEQAHWRPQSWRRLECLLLYEYNHTNHSSLDPVPRQAFRTTFCSQPIPQHSTYSTFPFSHFALFTESPDIVRLIRRMTMATSTATRQRRPSTNAPISELQGPVGPDFSRPKHKRTATGFGPSEIQSVESSIPEPQRAA